MIIRATKKILNTSGIKPLQNLNESDCPFPGEWYAGLVSTGKPGKMMIHFLHNSTKLSILCPGKSLNKALPEFPERLAQLLERLEASRYIVQFQVHSKPEIFTTNSRSILSHMNQMKYNIEYHASLAENTEDINYGEIEEIQSDALLLSGGSGKFETPKEILHRLVDAL